MQTGVAEEGDEILDSEQESNLEEDLPQGGENEEEGEAGEGAEETSDEPAGEEEETVVSIGSEEPPTSEEGEAETSVIADLRRRYRETSRELQKLRAQASGQPQVQQAPALRAKPTLEAHEFDAEKYEADLDKWYAEKREADKQAEAQEASRKAAAEAQQKTVQAVQQRYAESKAALKVKDFQEAEDEVVTAFADWQQGIAAKLKQPAEVVYALGKNPKKLTELASIKDPVEFAFAMADLRREIKVTTRKATNKPAPEKTVGGGSAGGSNSKATLERLEAEADKTGDRSKVIAYKRQLKAAGKK